MIVLTALFVALTSFASVNTPSGIADHDVVEITFDGLRTPKFKEAFFGPSYRAQVTIFKVGSKHQPDSIRDSRSLATVFRVSTLFRDTAYIAGAQINAALADIPAPELSTPDEVELRYLLITVSQNGNNHDAFTRLFAVLHLPSSANPSRLSFSNTPVEFEALSPDPFPELAPVRLPAWARITGGWPLVD